MNIFVIFREKYDQKVPPDHRKSQLLKNRHHQVIIASQADILEATGGILVIMVLRWPILTDCSHQTW